MLHFGCVVLRDPAYLEISMRLLIVKAAWLPIVLIALSAIYLPTLHNTPVFDDHLLTSGNLAAQYGSLFELKPRLLSYSSFVWLEELFGSGWWKHRIGNFLIHIVVVVAMWGFYREVLGSITAPAGDDGIGKASPTTYGQSTALGLAIGFFALNPVAVYAVAYLIQRSILMATLFVVLALWAFARALTTKNYWYFPLAITCYILGVMSKEHAIMAPLAAVPVFIVVARPSRQQLVMITAVGGLSIAAVGAILAMRYGEIIGKPFDEYSLIYLQQLAALGPDVEKNAFVLSIINQSYFFFKYGFHWIAPYTGWMSIDMRPPFPVSLFSFPHLLGLIGYAAVVIGGFVLVTRYRDGRALAGLSLLLPATLFSTEFSTVWVQDPFVLYRSYLWAIGIPGLVLFLVHDFPPKALVIIGTVLGMLFVWQAMDRGFSLATPEKVWSDAIAKLPNDPRSVGRWFPYLNRGDVYLEQDKLNEAYRDFSSSATLGDRGLGMYNIGAMFGMVGKYPESLKALADAEKAGYSGFGLEYQRGVALFGQGRHKAAYEAFTTALSKNPPVDMQSKCDIGLAKAAAAMGDRALAISHYDKAIAANPHDHSARIELASMHLAGNSFEAAKSVFSALLNDEPTGPAYLGRAIANHGLKLKEEAIRDIEAARQMAPDNSGVRDWQTKITAMP